MAASDALFFQIAAGLIPVLVLGLAVTDRFDPTTWEPKLRRRWGPLIVIGVGYVLVAELFAIELSFSGSRPFYKVAIVVYAMALSALFAGAVVALPFVQTMGRLGKRLTSVAGIAVLVFGSILLIDAVSDVREADARAEASCVSVAVERTAQARDKRFERSFERVASYEARRSELDRELRQLVAQPPSESSPHGVPCSPNRWRTEPPWRSGLRRSEGADSHARRPATPPGAPQQG